MNNNNNNNNVDDDDNDDDDENNNNDDDDDDDNNNNNRIERLKSIFFGTIFSLRSELSPTRTFMWPAWDSIVCTCNTSSAYRVQHVMCHVVGRDSSDIKFD